jgi:hypothetical protein
MKLLLLRRSRIFYFLRRSRKFLFSATKLA